MLVLKSGWGKRGREEFLKRQESIANLQSALRERALESINTQYPANTLKTFPLPRNLTDTPVSKKFPGAPRKGRELDPPS